MRRVRCPWCKSLNTVPYIAGNAEKGITSSGHVCDDCDTSWESEAERKKIKEASEARAANKLFTPTL